MRILAVLVLLSAFLVAPLDPTIDGASPEQADASIDHIRDTLTPEKQAQFDAALQLILRHELAKTLRALPDQETAPRPTASADVLQLLDGMTALEVIEYAATLRDAPPEH